MPLIALLLIALPQQSHALVRGGRIAPTVTPADVACNITTGTCTGTGGGTSLFTAATCDGVHDDGPAFVSFNTWATTVWQASHTGLIERDIPHGAKCMFITFGMSGVSIDTGIKKIKTVGLGAVGRGDGATFSDNIVVTTNAPTTAGNSVLHFASVPSQVVVGMPVFDLVNQNIPSGTAVSSISGGDVTINNPVTGSGIPSADPVSFFGNGWFLGGGATAGICHVGLNETSPPGCSARIATVSAGATCVTLLDPTIISRLTGAGITQAVVGGIDMQGFGYPPNNYFYDYMPISSVDASHQCDGTTAGASVHFSASLTNSYKSTWPVFNVGNAFEADQGGPATIWALNSVWDIEAEYTGITFDAPDFQTSAVGRLATFNNDAFTGSACGFPTQNHIYTANNSDLSTCSIEIDKMTDIATYNNSTIRRFAFQSATPNLFNLNNSIITEFIQGTPKKFAGLNSVIPSLSLGPIAYGAASEFDCTGCTINSLQPAGYVASGTPDFQMTSGVIKIPLTQAISAINNNGSGLFRITVPTTAAWVTGQRGQVDNGSGGTCGAAAGLSILTVINSTTIDLQASTFSPVTPNKCSLFANPDISAVPPAWAIPGANMLWKGIRQDSPPIFQIVDVTQTATAVLVQTSLAGTFPPSSMGNPIGIQPHIAPKFTCTGCTGFGASTVAGATAGAPFGSYYTRTIDKTTQGSSFTASIAGTVMTVTGSPSGSILAGDLLSGSGVTFPTNILSQSGGTPGGAGTYILDESWSIGSQSFTTALASGYIFGTLASVLTTVNTAYTGGGSPLAGLDGPFVVDPTWTNPSASFDAQVNPKQAGSCTTTPTTVTPTGAQSCSLITAPGAIWFVPAQATVKFTTSVGSDPVSVTTTIKTDQGVVNWLLKRDVDPASNDNDPMWLLKAA